MVFIHRIWRHTQYQFGVSVFLPTPEELLDSCTVQPLLDTPTSKVLLLKWNQGSSYQPLCNSDELSCLLWAPESNSWLHLLSVVPITQLSETANNLCKSIWLEAKVSIGCDIFSVLWRSFLPTCFLEVTEEEEEEEEGKRRRRKDRPQIASNMVLNLGIIRNCKSLTTMTTRKSCPMIWALLVIRTWQFLNLGYYFSFPLEILPVSGCYKLARVV